MSSRGLASRELTRVAAHCAVADRCERSCRFIHQNGLSSLDGLGCKCPGIVCLNVSSNQLTSLAGVEGCSLLSTLLCADNRLESVHDISPLLSCSDLQTLDLRRNDLSDFDELVECLRQLPHLKCLYLEGNPLARQTHDYRKRLVSALPHLTYLDDRPVFDEERHRAETWWVQRYLVLNCLISVDSHYLANYQCNDVACRWAQQHGQMAV